ncbi:SAM-dependent methyltransferase [Lewinellaceae bacterium SD302]|nr:SAM-dependent methyltransferase [Lewinellaceae bacterium SD302]
MKGEGKSGDLAIIFDRRKDRFIGLGLYDPDSPIRIKVLHQGSPAKVDQSFWANKVAVARALRENLLATETNSYRLLNGESDGFPGLIADVYAHVLVIKVYSLIWAPWLKAILEELLKVSDCKTVVLRLSRRVAGATDKPADWEDGIILQGQLEDEEIVFREHGILLKANVLQGHKTGFFLDHRHNRKRVGELAEGKSVLDIFSYAGGFSVHALGGGANEVTALDISEQALSVARENVALNFPATDNFQTLSGDAFEVLDKLAQRRMTYDLVVCDPPSFAKSENEIEGALKAYRRLTKLTVPLVAKGGILLAASCSARVDADTFFALQHAVLTEIGRPYEVIERTHHDLDHPATFREGNYLKSVYLRLL